MEGLISDYESFDMEDALENFKRFIKELKDFVLL
jgi:glutaredoxin-related protein